MTLRKIIVTTDLSSESEPALAHAARWAAKYDAALTLLTVVDFDADLPPGVLALSADKEKLFRDEVHAKVTETLGHLRDKYFSDLAKVTTAVEEGSGAAATIVAYAKRNDAGLIIISTHGRSGLGRVLLGSVAERVVRTAECAVLTIPAESSN